jgi:hypothetical protein
MKKICAFLLVSCVLLWMIPASAQNVQRGAIVIHEYHHDVSPPVRDLVASNLFIGNRQALLSPIRILGAAGNTRPDPVAQTEILPDVGTTNLLNFDGIPHTGFVPPDTNASVGATQVVETVNLSYAVYDKTTGAQIKAPTLISSIFSGFGGTCTTGSTSDPVVLWDKAAQRWVVSVLAFTGNFTSTECYAVSTSTDATGSYNRYGFTFANGLLADYPKTGVWPDAYYLSFNGFQGALSFIGAEACALDRTKMLTGATATMVCFPPKTTNYSLLPSDMDGTTAPPSGAPNHFLELDAVSFTKLDQFDFHVDFVTPTNSTFTGPIALTIPSWTQICPGTRVCIPEPSPGEKVDSQGDRLMFRLAYRNFGDHEALVAVHTVKPSTGTATGATRWYEFRSTPPGGTFTKFQAGTVQNKTASLWEGSIAMDKTGDIAVGMSASGTTLDPSVMYTGRVPTDPLGKMEKAVVVIKGTGVQSNGSGNRWGDYSSMVIDSSDDCTFWYTQEYYKTTGAGAWNTRLNSFKFTGCN